MTALYGNGMPGQGSLQQTVEREIIWGGDESKGLYLRRMVVIDGAARDAGSSPTTILTPGLLLAIVTSGGLAKQWDYTATDGTQNLAGALQIESIAIDPFGSNANRMTFCVIRAPLVASQLRILGAAFIGHAAEFLARRQLAKAGNVLNDDPFNYLAGINPRFETVTGSTTITEAKNGTTYYVNGSGAVTMTLPAIKVGLCYRFLNLADQNMVIASTEGDNIVIENDLSADSITFSTPSKKIGAQLAVAAEYVNGTLKWVKQSEPGFTESTAT